MSPRPDKVWRCLPTAASEMQPGQNGSSTPVVALDYPSPPQGRSSLKPPIWIADPQCCRRLGWKAKEFGASAEETPLVSIVSDDVTQHASQPRSAVFAHCPLRIGEGVSQPCLSTLPFAALLAESYLDSVGLFAQLYKSHPVSAQRRAVLGLLGAFEEPKRVFWS
ncbi:hypothetical protein GQ53DRAFT_307394 [Thozetella sp. PMI_491]|nr:hypothetical protein GQ53DRAFT_307394 [Thozetella sp. PMI_491]